MPRKLELEALEAELAGLSLLLTEARAINDTVGIIQFEQKTHELELEIQTLKDAKISEASVAIYFRGDPVVGSRGIAASFAGKALNQFQEVISRQFAKAELGTLGERGPVPLKDATALMVTGLAQGSFGFILDEMHDQTQMFDTALKITLDEVMNIIDAAGSVEDAMFEDAAEELDPRTLIALREFFLDLDSSAATLRLVADSRDFSLDELAVHRARIRTEATQIVEEDEEKSGILIGFLPEHRRFELQLFSGETIYGSASKESTEQYLHAIQSGNRTIGVKCRAKIIERTVKPLNRPPRFVYRLLEFITLQNNE
jgi:hypothetical protein